jgi:hypothetical protein
MKITIPIAASILFLAAPAYADSPFDGTWKGDVKSAQLPTKPDVISLVGGVYRCSSCTPAWSVPADGVSHPVKGLSYSDEISVRVVDARTIEETDKFKGKIVSTSTARLSADGKRVAIHWVDTSAPDGKPTNGDVVQQRVGPARAGAHAITGQWRTSSVANISDEALTSTFALAGDRFSMKSPQGYGYEAMLGGPAVPIVGDQAGTMAKLRRVSATSIEETDMRDGKAVSVMTMTAAPDHRTLRVVSRNLKQGTTLRYDMIKQ